MTSSSTKTGMLLLSVTTLLSLSSSCTFVMVYVLVATKLQHVGVPKYDKTYEGLAFSLIHFSKQSVEVISVSNDGFRSTEEVASKLHYLFSVRPRGDGLLTTKLNVEKN